PLLPLRETRGAPRAAPGVRRTIPRMSSSAAIVSAMVRRAIAAWIVASSRGMQTEVQMAVLSPAPPGPRSVPRSAFFLGGGEGIRTPGTLASTAVFKTLRTSRPSRPSRLSKPHGNRQKTPPVRVLGTTPLGFGEDARTRQTATHGDHERRDPCEWDVNG